jgi:hypothetical protein
VCAPVSDATSLRCVGKGLTSSRRLTPGPRSENIAAWAAGLAVRLPLPTPTVIMPAGSVLVGADSLVDAHSTCTNTHTPRGADVSVGMHA